jgi:hypothetical protein
MFISREELMSPSRRTRSVYNSSLMLEALEARQLLAGDTAAAVVSGLVAVQAGQNAVTTASLIAGETIHAQAGQPFQAVIGTIRNPSAVPAVFLLRGSIDWGDGTVSQATFVHQADGTTAVLGSHTYSAAGTDTIQVVVMAFPPAGSLAAVRLVGTIHSKAEVITPNWGVTLSETVGAHFTANLGLIRSNAALPAMTAIINWGDGTVSTGKILATPGADPLGGGSLAVVGDHTYAAVGSYAVHITLLPLTALPVDAAATAAVVSIDSVIDVLPVLPSIA